MTNLIQNLLRALDVGRLQVDFIVLICWCQVNPDLVSCDLNSDPRTALKMNGLHCTALHGGVFPSFFVLFGPLLLDSVSFCRTFKRGIVGVSDGAKNFI